jgi:hypothetical protein
MADTYKGKIEQLIFELEKSYAFSEWIRECAIGEEIESWTVLRAHLRVAIVSMSKLKSNLSDDRASMKLS